MQLVQEEEIIITTNEPTDRAEVKGRPPAYLVMGIVLAWLLDRFIFLIPFSWDSSSSKNVGWRLIIVGVGIGFSIAGLMCTPASSRSLQKRL